MARYIDADKLKNTLKFLRIKTEPYTSYEEGYEDGLERAFEDVIPQIINNEPTADVAPVIHAHWINIAGGKTKICSYCNIEQDATFHDIDEGWEYCPKCGAIMDEKIK